MPENHPNKPAPEPNTEMDVCAYYLLERNDANSIEIFNALSPAQINAITNTWDHIEDLALPMLEGSEMQAELHMAMCDVTVRIIDGTTTLDTLMERKRHTSPGTVDYIKAELYIQTARFALNLLERGAFITPRRQNHYNPKGY